MNFRIDHVNSTYISVLGPVLMLLDYGVWLDAQVAYNLVCKMCKNQRCIRCAEWRTEADRNLQTLFKKNIAKLGMKVTIALDL